MGAFVRKAGDRANTYSHAEREFVDQVLSADWKTNVVQKTHIPDALSPGIRMETIEALRYGHEEDLPPAERHLAPYIPQAWSGTVDDQTFAGLHRPLGMAGVPHHQP